MARRGVSTSQGGKRSRAESQDGGRYARYTKEQIDLLERIYLECSNPSHSQQLKIIQEHPLLRGIDMRQLKVWFQNRRCREKQKKENTYLLSEHKRLTSANRLLKDENDGLQKKLVQLIAENEQMQNQVVHLTSSVGILGTACQQTEPNNPPPPPPPSLPAPRSPIHIADNNMGYMGAFALAEETKVEFLAKAVGNAIHWTPAPGLKLYNPGSVGTFYVPSSCIGVAARACVSIPYDAVEAIEILKDRPLWSTHCRNMTVIDKYTAENGGTIEFIYTQYYAPTTMACARDFWTLRYSTVTDDGSFLVCERSISGSEAPVSSPTALEYVRGEKLASGYLVYPTDSGSTIYMVEHFDMEASSVVEVIRPLYESPEFMAKQMIVAAFHYMEHMHNEKNGKLPKPLLEEPRFMRFYSRKLQRSFNDAVNGFHEDGWTLLNADPSDDLIMSVKPAKSSSPHSNFDTVVCVKAVLLLQNIVPMNLIRALQASASTWLDFDFSDGHSEPYAKAVCFAFPSKNSHDISEAPVQLGHTLLENEALGLMRFRRVAERLHNISAGDIFHIQVIRGMQDSGFGRCSELICAPTEKTMPNEPTLLSYGFRIFSLGSTGATPFANSRNATSSLPPSLLILAFQFPYESHCQDEALVMARQYMKNVISIVKRLAHELRPLGARMRTPHRINQDMAPVSPEASFPEKLTHLISRCYRVVLGVDLLGINPTGSSLEQIQSHQYAILCLSFSSLPVCLYGNNQALEMLEATAEDLLTLSVDRILGVSDHYISLFSVLPIVLQKGYAVLPPGHSVSMENHLVSYGQAVVWQVPSYDGSIYCLALAFVNWEFM